MLGYETFPLGPLSANCVMAWDGARGAGVVVDPGDEAEAIRLRVERRAFQVEAILLTHAHFDHLGAAKLLQEHWQCPVYLHAGDHSFLSTLDMQTGLFGMKPVPAPDVTALCPGVTYHGFRVLHTPGHTPGSCCFLGDSEDGPVLIAGDTLFQGGVGRTDLLGGSWEHLEQSIRKELYGLSDRTRVLPGHGPETTIGEEARTNAFIRR